MSERLPSLRRQQRLSLVPDIRGNTYLKYCRVQDTFVVKQCTTSRKIPFFVSGWALMWGFFVASLPATATAGAVTIEQACLTNSYRCGLDDTEGLETYSEHPDDNTVRALLEEGSSSPNELYFPVAARELRTPQQQFVKTTNWGATDEETGSLDLPHGRSGPSQFLSEGDSLRVQHNAGSAIASFKPHLPLFSALKAALPEQEGMLDASTQVAIRSGEVLNAQSLPHTVRASNPVSCSEGILFPQGGTTASEIAARYMINSEDDAETMDDEGTPSAPFRRMQQFDPLRFGPAAQYAQYLSTFTPPAQQQQQLQMLQQAIAAGVGGNPAALKRLQRRAQAAAYANSVSSHPLIQGVVRTAYTTVAEILNSVSLADVVQGALGGGAALLPPIV